MTAPTTLVTTIQQLAHEEWKENAFPVIHNGRVVRWNPYANTADQLLIAAYVAKTQGMSAADYDLFEKKLKECTANKITGKGLIYRTFRYDDRKSATSNQKMKFVDSITNPKIGFVFTKECLPSIIKDSNSLKMAIEGSSNKDYVQFLPSDVEYLTRLSRLPLEHAEFKITGQKRLNLADNEQLDLPEYYIKALRQDSPVFDKLLEGEKSIFDLSISKQDLNLLLMFAYDGDMERFQFELKGAQILHLGELALKFEMENVLDKVRQKLYNAMLTIETFEKFDLACSLYRIYAGSRYPEIEELLGYFSTTVSKCNLADFRKSITKLNEIGLTSFKLWPQNDGNDNEKIGILVELMTNIQSLDLSCQGDLNPRKLDSISGLNKLEWLFLNTCDKLDDAALAEIGKVTTLTNLILSGKTFTDKGLVRLGNLSNLRQIVIWGPSSITDEGVKVFNQLNNLEWVRLHECKNVSDEALKRLKAPQVSKKFM